MDDMVASCVLISASNTARLKCQLQGRRDWMDKKGERARMLGYLLSGVYDGGGFIPELDSLGLACCYVIKGNVTDDRRRLTWD